MSALRFSVPELALVAVTCVWGLTFLLVEAAMAFSGPLYFVAMRFAMAALALAAFTGSGLHGITRREIAAGGFIGAAIATGYSLQTAGVVETGASRSAFITALYVPLVPLLQWLVLRRRPALAAQAGAALAFAGLLLIGAGGNAGADGGANGGGGFGRGEMLTLLSAFAFAGEIILIGAAAGRVDSRRVTVIQVAAGAVLSCIAAILTGEPLPRMSGELAALVLCLGALSALIQQTMNWAQQSVSPTRATIIYSAEPVWAAIFARIAGQALPLLAAAGGALIVAGVLVSELKPRRWRK